MPKGVLESVLEFILESEYQALELLDFSPITAYNISNISVFQGKVQIFHCVLFHMSHGIQEVSGSIPLISTTSPENHWFSGLFLVIIANNRCIIRIFRTGALHPGLRYSPYRNRTGITTVPGGPIRPNPSLFPRKRHRKTSRLPSISPAPERADSALSCPHRRDRRCSEW